MWIAFFRDVSGRALEHAIVGSYPSLHICILAYLSTPTVGLHEPLLHLCKVQRAAAVAHPTPELDAVLEEIPIAETPIQALYFIFHRRYLRIGQRSGCKYPVVSVENFYHLLYETLLKPVNFRMRYYYPFGSCRDIIHVGVDSEREWLFRRPAPMVLFHFDQEPIYPDDDLKIYQGMNMRRVRDRYPQLLANSEHSTIKKKVCAEYHLLDWYFFYHGFAALDWYRDARYFARQDQINRVFISLNHLVRHKRSYRMSLLARMFAKDLVQHGIISFHGTSADCAQELDDAGSFLTDTSRELILHHLLPRADLPFTVDAGSISGNASAAWGHNERAMREQAMWSVVNETVFYESKLHLTEKIFQPIVCSRPFILSGAPGNLQYLRSYGFKTFGEYIDESYDLEVDPDRRQDLILEQLQKLCEQPMSSLRDMLQHMRPILDHNKRHFFTQFRHIISCELIDNFDQCSRIWNNGRVDGRTVALHDHLQQVKDLLVI